MWVDRSFIIDGIGRVITGTASSNFNMDKIYFSSQQEKLEIKELQSINESYEESLNSKRIAMSLKKNNKKFPKRGNLLSNEKINFTNLLFVRFRNKIVDKTFQKGTKRMFIGATNVLIKNIWNIDSKEYTYGLIELNKKIPILSNENFVIQNIENNKYSGGKFQFFINNKFLKNYIISQSINGKKITSLYDLFTVLEKNFVESDIKTINIDNWHIEEDALNNIEKDLNENYKKINKTGFVKYMNSKYFIDQEILDKLVQNFNNLNIVENRITINLKNEEDDSKTFEAIKTKLGKTLDVNKVNINDYEKESIKSLFLSEKIYRISKNIIIADSHLEILLKHIEKLPLEFTVSQFKEKTNLSRKYAIPMLELLDKKLITSKINTSGNRKKLL